MARIILIRHGQAAFGSSCYDSLTEVGTRQAEILGTHFNACGIALDRVVSGEMVRQRETARLASASMGRRQHIESLTAFNEYDHMGIIDAYRPQISTSDPSLVEALETNFSNRTFQPFFEKVVSLWMAGVSLPRNVETFSAFAGRVRSGVTHLAERLGPHETAGVFTSGGVIAMALGLALNTPPQDAMHLSWLINNGSYSTLHVGKTRMSLMNTNVTAHLAIMGKEWVTYR
jgi:broad specificity phosphatase PhoE